MSLNKTANRPSLRLPDLIVPQQGSLRGIRSGSQHLREHENRRLEDLQGSFEAADGQNGARAHRAD